MKRILLPLLFAVLAMEATAADRKLGYLPDGTAYIKDEVDFCLKAGVARALSPSGAGRRRVDRSHLVALHPQIADVIGTHLCAATWLNGDALPPLLKHTGDDVPVIARSLKAMLHAGADAATVVRELRTHPDVQWASLNRLCPVTETPNDCMWSNQWGPIRINATNAWDVTPATYSVFVAVIDTGVDLTHPDLASHIVYNKGFGANTSGDAHRDVRGGSSIDHGTHVAGIVGAIRDNNLGIAGVAGVGIMAMGCGDWVETKNAYLIGSDADAINDSVAHGATVINCSFSQPAPLDDSVRSALDNAQQHGVVVVCAAGNDGTSVANSGSAGWAQHPWPILVSNIQQNDTLNPNSNYGPEIGLAAPGSAIYSTVTTNYTAPTNCGGTYGFMWGTSQASPHVAGGAAMVRAMNPNRVNGAGVRDLLFRMAQDLPPAGKDNTNGYGVLQLSASFLSTLKSANTFAGASSGWWIANGDYEGPYTDIPSALAVTPPGGTIVLNGGVGFAPTPHYPAQPITNAVTLTAFPDRPVVIGN